MSARRLAPWALLLTLAAAPASAEPRRVSLSAFVGAGMLLGQVSGNALSLDQSLWDLQAGLAASGGYFNPHVLRWSGGLTWNGLTGTAYQGSSATSRLGYQANAVIMGGSSLPVTLEASRSFTDLTTSAAGATTLGNTATTSLGGSVAFTRQKFPTISAALNRVMIDTERPVLGDRTFYGNTRLTTGVSQSTAPFDYAATYDTNWSNGTYAEQGYRSHGITARASARLVEGLRLSLNDNYYLRQPTVVAPTNPRYDTNALSTNLQWLATSAVVMNFGYTNSQSLIAPPGAEEINRRGQALTQSLQYKWTDALWLTQNAVVDYAAAQVGARSQAGYGQRVGAGLLFQRPLAFGAMSLAANGSGGLVEPVTGGIEPQWGAGASGTLSVKGERMTGAASYGLSWSQGGAGVSGSSFSQNARVEATALPVARSRVTASLTANSARRDDLLLGTMLNRALILNVDGTYAQHRAQLSGGLTDGVDTALANPGATDGLFLPAAYNTHLRYLQLVLSTMVDSGRLQLRVVGRLTDVEAPGRAAESAGGLTAGATWAIGRFRLSLEDRFTGGSRAGLNFTENVIVVRLSRDFSVEL